MSKASPENNGSNGRDDKGRFISGNRGKPHGSTGGRHKAIEEIDFLFKKAKNRKALQKDLQMRFDANPTEFLLKVVLPFIPKEMILKAGIGVFEAAAPQNFDEWLSWEKNGKTGK